LSVPSKLVEYPIEIQERPSRKTALESLGLDPSKIHILNVGLFTPRKNQKEIAEYAKELLHLPVQFHFVGNQAGNFEFYWKPIMDNLPENCVVWGERKDTDAFYSSMDLFLFTSKGTVHDKETNPLSLKEALAWDMNILMYNLPVYLNKYDYVPNVSYLTQDIAQNIAMIGKFINFNRED
jgi:glycosyltransferase involved in cell wall biosynthesis